MIYCTRVDQFDDNVDDDDNDVRVALSILLFYYIMYNLCSMLVFQSCSGAFHMIFFFFAQVFAMNWRKVCIGEFLIACMVRIHELGHISR